MPPTTSADTFCFRVGDFECFAISDGVFPHADEKFLFGPDAPLAEVAERLAGYGQPPHPIPIPLNFLVVRASDHLVVIDAGYGELAPLRNAPAGCFLERFNGLGLRAEDVGTVILTHAHADHVGGIARDGRLVFPNARFALGVQDAVMLRDTDGWPRDRFRLIAGRAVFVDAPAEPVPGIRLIPAPGHTPGNLFVELRSRGDSLFHVVDLFAHPVHLERSEWAMAHESDRPAVAALRRRTMEEVGDSGQRLFSSHMPFPGLGCIERTPAGFRWRSEDASGPSSMRDE